MGKLPRVVAAMSSAVMTRARVVLLAHGVSEHSTRVRIAHGAQVDPALGAAQVVKVRDPHPVQGALIPLAHAVILMGHRAPPAAPRRARVRELEKENEFLGKASAFFASRHQSTSVLS